MKNDFEIRGDVTVIFLRRKDGSIIEALIDTEDLPKVQAFKNTWFATGGNPPKYAMGIVKSGKRRSGIYLHRQILDVEEGFLIDHINRNTFDNRKANLRVATKTENGQNVGTRKDNTSGFRGVSWDNRRSQFEAYCIVNGKKSHVGYFDTAEEANEAVVAARKNLMPFSYEGGQNL